MNKHAQKLGRMGKGKKKNMTPAAMNQRREASIKARLIRQGEPESTSDANNAVLPPIVETIVAN